ncbi:protein kinase [Alloactinosynnema sp. L-07]|uniref:serine/threonine-protein kinase n=1 Tax=Alloactinosynnema sp. L-07 TaxID=1653480 RepID=UPI00065EFF05|nr:serine/threonine-protein kinase [Alloactinosynnema sp. L-07]CRK59885.1 protein kinase [Alloactinosynnema sp. L-07]
MQPPVIPGLTLAGPLGQGGFGTVFLARQDRLERDVAVKVDNRVLATERDRIRFLREARAAARLSGHPNVVNVYDAGVTPDGCPYIVMELCTGGSLADVQAREGVLAVDRVIEIGGQLADALAHAHAAGILHRDIKPANILVNAFGAVKLADFGLAAILDAHAEHTVTVGALSPNYAAPEVFAHAAPSRAGDIYSLGATLYTLASGRRPRDIPWPSSSLDSLVAALRAPVAPIEHAPPLLNSALLGALEADSGRRTLSAEQLRDELRGLLPPRRITPAVTPKRRAGRIAAGAVAGVALLAAGFLARGLVTPETAVAQNSQSGQSADTSKKDAVPPKMADCGKASFCVTDACFGGLVTVGDRDVQARAIPCTEPHPNEAFSGLWLSDENAILNVSQILELPEVKAACSAEVMRERTETDADTTGWEIDIIPSDAGAQGRTYLYCIAGPAEGDSSRSVFTGG